MKKILQGIYFLMRASELLDEKYSDASTQLLQLAYSILNAENISKEQAENFKKQVDDLVSSDSKLEDRA